MATTPDTIVLILCGGTGPRLWPLSRASHPKQFLRLGSSDSLLTSTYQRFAKIYPPSNIYLVSQRKFASLIRQHLPQLDSRHLIFEPSKKNTLPAIFYAISKIPHLNPNTVIISSPADHFISPLSKFRQTLNQASSLARSSSLLTTIGISPSRPDPSYGYIFPSKTSNIASKFTEKPSITQAQKFLTRQALWNSGIYLFTRQTFDQLLLKYFPGSDYRSIPPVSIDVGFTQNLSRFAFIRASFSWSDIGEYETIYQLLSRSGSDNIPLNTDTTIQSLDSKHNLVSSTSGKIVGLIGIDHLAVIDTPDALLICPLDQSHRVREMVKQIVGQAKLKKYFLK